MNGQRRGRPARQKGLGEKLYSFVVYTDSHVNQSETESMSPHQVNKLANGRHRFVLNRINEIEPAFAIHLGDLVHPVPVMGIYADAARRFHEQATELLCPLHFIPGNHDIGDKPIRWGPAEIVSDESVALWRKHFGPDYSSFGHQGCRFVLINAETINSGLAAEYEQRAWLEAELEAYASDRIFVAIHYPPFVYRADELEYYDNLAEPGRSWLLRLFRKFNVEAVFAGHVHNFWYHRIGETAFYILPSITFVRHDYSEMYRVPAGREAGRNDAAKLGYFVVDVHEHGHACHPMRTNGERLEPDAPLPEKREKVSPLHPALNVRDNFGFDLRQPWAEVVEIPPSGGLDEFARKIVRNDYPLLALWEMGVRKLRVPFQDLLDARLRDRMRDMQGLGMGFTIFSYKIPAFELLETLIAHGDLVDSWELAVPPEEIEATLEKLRPLRSECEVPIYLSRLRSKDDMETDGQRYYHVINHGYVAGERAMVEELAANALFREVASGFVFRIPRERACWDEIIAIGDMARDLDIRASVHVRLATSNPAAEACDDLENANQIAEALTASLTQPHINVFLDTFADVDRGYFVRTGVVDRRFNPRLGLQVVRYLLAAFAAQTGSLRPLSRMETEDCSSFAIGGHDGIIMLVLPKGSTSAIPLPESELLKDSTSSQGSITSLETGEIRQVSIERLENSGIRMMETGPCEVPFLLRVSRVSTETSAAVEAEFNAA